MKLLLAALRESATTTLKKGRFLAPPRERRITTMIKDRVEKGVILRELRWDWQGKSGFGLSASPSLLRAQTVPGKLDKTNKISIMVETTSETHNDRTDIPQQPGRTGRYPYGPRDQSQERVRRRPR